VAPSFPRLLHGVLCNNAESSTPFAVGRRRHERSAAIHRHDCPASNSGW